MAANPLAMDLGSTMDVDVGSLHVSVGNALNAMNNQMSMDVDLFGDPLDIQEMAHPTIASKQLQQRLDELRARGCCQGIAWSRQGTIASISEDGRSVDLSFLRSHPENGSWHLSQPTPCVSLSPTLPGCPIVHLAFASTSSPELAIIDSVGRVSILSFALTLNRNYMTRKWDADLADDLHAVVGCYWLPLIPQSRQYHVMYGPAVRESSGYVYQNSIVPGSPPWHPNPGKSALLCVTTSGILKLLFSQNNNKIEETTVELENVNSSEDHITHASISSDRNTLIIALATASKHLKVVRVTIQWGQPQQSDKQVPPASVALNPVMKVRHISTTSWFEYGPSESHLDTSMARLSHIEVLPQALDGQPSANANWSPAMVLTVRSYVAGENSPYNQEQQSIVDRWELLDRQQKLHTVFEGLNVGSGSQPSAATRLRKLEPIIIPKIIISIHVMQLGKVICFAFSDGTLQYRDRHTMQEIYNEPNVNKIMSPIQVGFEFTEQKPCLQVAFSPTNCSFVQICEDEKIRWSTMKFPSDVVGTSMHDGQYAAIVAALSIAMSSAAIQQTNYDDILALARPFAEKHERFSYDWIMELVRMLKVTVDYSEEAHHDSLVRNSNLHLCLSILQHLGFRGEYQPRTFGGKFAMLALNVRNIVVLITIASNTPVTLKQTLSPLDEPEVVDALAGCAKWSLDLLSWLTDSLFNLLDDPEFTAILNNQRRFAELTRFLQKEKNVALHLLLCSSTRGYLSAACRRLFHLESLSQRAINFYENKAAIHNATDPAGAANRSPGALYHAYQKMQRFTSTSLVKIGDMDKLLTALGAEIRKAYQDSLTGLAHRQGSGPNGQQPGSGGGAGGGANSQQGQGQDPAVKRAQMHCELSMLLASTPPHSFQGVLLIFFNKFVRSYRGQTDPAKLFFANYALLEVEDDPESIAERKSGGMYVDVFKRCELYAADRLRNGHLQQQQQQNGAGPNGGQAGEVVVDNPDQQWRRCVRCSAVMENVSGHRPGFTFVLAQQRKCACGGAWGLLHKGKMVS